MKNGLIIENGVPTYYENDLPVHKGIVKDGKDIYYIGKDGKAVTGEKFVHSSMTHQIIKHGTYQFGSDYKMKRNLLNKPVRKEDALSAKLKQKLKKISSRISSKSSSRPLLRSTSRSSSRFSSRRSKLKLNKKQQTILVSIIVALILLLFGTIAIFEHSNSVPAPKIDDTAGATASSNRLSVTPPTIEEEIWLVNKTTRDYYTEGTNLAALSKTNLYQPFSFSYSISCTDKPAMDMVQASFSLSEDPSMQNAAVYTIDPWEKSLSIDNLKVDTAYYYRFEASVKEETYTYDGSFRTAATHRLLSVPDLVNIRDVGGRKTTDGKTVKQNRIIRGSELDGLVENSYYLREDSINDVRSTFGFRSEMDLRNPTVAYPGYESRLGSDVKHTFFNSPTYASAVSEANLPAIKKIFSYLADESNYPIYLHCTHGVDRTGTVVYLLDALLGLSEKEMSAEYALSKADPNDLIPLRNALDRYKGDTINEKVENYMIESVGLTADEIASIRSIMLTD